MAHVLDPLCELCEELPAAHHCITCGPVLLCQKCDALEHKNPLRAKHIRTRVGDTDAAQTRQLNDQTESKKNAKSVFYLEAKIISHRKVGRVKEESATVADMKKKIEKIVHLAQKPGTEAESEHAKAVAQRLMRKYRLDLADILASSATSSLTGSGALFEGSYTVQIMRTSGVTGGPEIKTPKWFSALSQRVSDFFQDLVRSVHFIGTAKYAFYGHEPSAWEAAGLFVELFNTIGYYRQSYADKHHPGANALDNFAFGMVRGLSFIEQNAEKDTSSTDQDDKKLALVHSTGKSMLDAMTSRMKIVPSRKRRETFNAEAYRAGKKQAAQINVADLGKEKIDAA